MEVIYLGRFHLVIILIHQIHRKIVNRRLIKLSIHYFFNIASELATIARRHDFEPLYEQCTNSENNSKWTNAGVFFANKTIDSDSNGIHNTG